MSANQITLSLSVGEAQTVLQALGKLPFDQVADTWLKIKNQAEQQLAAQQQTEAEVRVGGTD